MKVHTFRLEEDVLEKLDRTAQREHVSMNVVVGRALRDFVDYAEVIEKMGVMTLSRSSLMKLLDYLTDDEAMDAGRHTATGSALEAERTIFGKESLNGYLRILEVGDRQSKVHSFTRSTSPDGTIDVILVHNLGRKWSLFMHAAVDSRMEMFRKTGQAKDYSVEHADNQVVFRVVPMNPSPPIAVTAGGSTEQVDLE